MRGLDDGRNRGSLVHILSIGYDTAVGARSGLKVIIREPLLAPGIKLLLLLLLFELMLLLLLMMMLLLLLRVRQRRAREQFIKGIVLRSSTPLLPLILHLVY